VSLVVTDPLSCNGTDTATSTVTVIDDSIFVDFTYNIIRNSCDSLIVQFTNTSINATSYFWDFGDGTTSTLPSPRHTYTVADTFLVTFTAANPNVCNQPDTLTEPFILQPRVTALFDPTNGCVPYFYELENLGNNIATTYWELGNGQSSTDLNPTFDFDSVGTFTLRLTNYNPESCNDSASFTGTFNVFAPPTAFFETDSSAFQLFLPILFDNQSTFPAFYSWDFGDGDSSAQRNPFHEYRDTGFFEPCLTVLDNNQCTATYCKNLEIYFIGVVDVPNAFSPNNDGSNDVLYVRGYGVTEMEFKIFNRWGELVFESNSLDVGWDGTYKDKGQEMEVYIYTLWARFLDGSETGVRKGNITLLR
jgi:gliding motility-associated-like protein